LVDGPSLEDTMKFIQDKMGVLQRVDWTDTEYAHDYSSGNDSVNAVYKVTQEVT
jgi:hypothetical protein